MMCYYYPPVSVVGVHRSVGFALSLPALGWDPVVLTVRDARDRSSALWRGAEEPPDVVTVRTPEWDLSGAVDLLQGITSRLARWLGIRLTRNVYRDFLCVPDEQIAWATTRPGARLARTVDLVYATCSPFSSAISGCRIKRLTGKPLVVDFRDAWLERPHKPWPPLLRRRIERLEQSIVSECDRLILTSQGTADAYRRRYPAFAEKIVVITNGYDRLNVASMPPARSPFRIMHVGEFYGGRSPRPLLEAIELLAKPDIEFVQVGPPCREIDPFLGRVPLTVTGIVPRSRALELMRQASLLYLNCMDPPGTTAPCIMIAAKTYEYLTTGLPILADLPPGDSRELIERYARASYLPQIGDVQGLAKAIAVAYQARPTTVPAVDEAYAREFSREALTRRLVAEFERVLRGRVAPVGAG
jgi:glycosyltransferase involved in cell wall biosynthesis